MERKLHIDGVADDGWTYEGGSMQPPFVVFDEDAQENVAGPFPHYWMARAARYALRMMDSWQCEHPREPGDAG